MWEGSYISSYIIRDIDEDLWRKVKTKAASEGASAKDVILHLLTEWVGRAQLSGVASLGLTGNAKGVELTTSPPDARPKEERD